MNQLVADLLQFAPNLFARFHPKLDELSDVFLEDPQDRVTGLKIDFALGAKIGGDKGEQDRKQKREAFHTAFFAEEARGWRENLEGERPASFSTTQLAGAAPALQFGMDSVAENLERVRSQIAEAAQKSGRAVNEIELVAISKTHEAEKVRAAFDAGQELFGESRVQEARAKIPLLPSAARWHFVGRLQKNKVRHALPLFELFHSIDSVDLARQMDRIAEEEGLRPRVLLEVNVAGEGSKIGFAPDALRAQMEVLLGLPRLTIEGVMTIPPLAPEPENSRQYFAALRKLRDQIAAEFKVPLPELSMGMTGDFSVAVEEGATLVRVGTAIFGKRTPLALRKTGDPDS